MDNFGDVDDFLDTTLKAQSERKIGKLDFIKIKHFYFADGTVKGMKREDTDWKKIFPKHLLTKDCDPTNT